MIINQETINKYLEGIDNHNTRKTYKYSLVKFYKFLQNNNNTEINQKNLSQVIHDYKAYLNNKNLKVITINQHLIIFKTFINEYTKLSYDKDLKLIKTLRKKPHYLTTQQIQIALSYTEDKTDELIIKLLTSTGLRIHEALNITKNELENTDEKENAIITIIGKNTKTRLIVIPNKLTRQLKRYSQEYKKYIFESSRKESQPLTSRSIQCRFKKLAAKIDKEENTTIYCFCSFRGCIFFGYLHVYTEWFKYTTSHLQKDKMYTGLKMETKTRYNKKTTTDKHGTMGTSKRPNKTHQI